MSEAAWAGIVLPIEDHIVVVIRTWTHGHGIQLKLVTYLPRDHVICAGRITTQAKAADDFAVLRVQGETASTKRIVMNKDR